MKTLFSEYYVLSPKEYTKIWENALVVFDTNILMNLYRFSEDASSDFISVMKSYKRRLWIPYQVAWEFQRNRISTIISNEVAYKQLCGKLDEEITKALASVKNWKDALYKEHPYIKLDSIEQTINRSKDTIKKKLIKQQSEYPFSVNNDYIFDQITDLYNGKVGGDYNEEQYNKLFIEAKKRYKEKTPPGYCDEDEKKGKIDKILYGDVILWKQIIDKSKSEKKDIIFVSNDEKEDWRLKHHGKIVGARKELIKEFESTTGQKILIYNSKLFVEYAKKNNTEVKVSKRTIDEIIKVQQEDELRRSTPNYYASVDKNGNIVIRNSNEPLCSDSILGTSSNHISAIGSDYLRNIGVLPSTNTGTDYWGVTKNPFADITPSYLKIDEPYDHIKAITEPYSVTSFLEKQRNRIEEIINPKPYKFTDPEGLISRISAEGSPIAVKIPGLDKDL